MNYSNNNNKRNFKYDLVWVNGLVERRNYRVLLDTGASFSVISEQAVSSLKLKRKVVKSEVSLFGAGGDLLNIVGKIKLRLRFDTNL